MERIEKHGKMFVIVSDGRNLCSDEAFVRSPLVFGVCAVIASGTMSLWAIQKLTYASFFICYATMFVWVAGTVQVLKIWLRIDGKTCMRAVSDIRWLMDTYWKVFWDREMYVFAIQSQMKLSDWVLRLFSRKHGIDYRVLKAAVLLRS